jgi:ATP-binding cassette subfamily B protein
MNESTLRFSPDDPLEHSFQGEHSLRTLGYMFSPERGRLTLAFFFFIIKHSPVWLLPLLTANIVDVLVTKRPLAELWQYAALAVVLLAQNVPMHFLYVRQLSLAVRAVELRLRSAICRRLQLLSIGFYARTNAGVLQSKAVRDVEAV